MLHERGTFSRQCSDVLHTSSSRIYTKLAIVESRDFPMDNCSKNVTFSGTICEDLWFVNPILYPCTTKALPESLKLLNPQIFFHTDSTCSWVVGFKSPFVL